jgi:F-type H+-transporting ATPase subunit epsilon
MREFHLQIVTPDGLIFDGECESVAVKTTTGDVQIMSGHADFFAPLSVGVARIVTRGEGARAASVQGGFISVGKSCVKLIATTFEFASDIDVLRATRAKEKAEAMLAEAKNEAELSLAKAKLLRALTRLDAAKEKR